MSAAESGPHPAAPSPALPSGTVTFAFTDIEGSTQRWDRDRAAMQAAVCRHDELMRAAIAAHGGHVFKTIGDAFCAAFARAEDAVAAMYDAQRALVAEDFSAVDGLRVRVAINTGTVDERDGDYFGPTVNRVARLLPIGHGGQVLISGVAADLLQGTLPPHTSLLDLGEHRLRDLARPERVYQLVADGIAAEFPALRSLDILPNNLPPQMTSFVGRESEIAEITALFGKHRIVTLVGPGGVGKTRTSLQVAANLLDSSHDGVWLIELAPLVKGEYIPSTIAQTLGLTLGPGEPLDNLVRALSHMETLLVFDNCEHLIEPVARVIAAIAQSSPKVKILASSRQALQIAGEQTYRLPSLDVPSESDAARFAASDARGSAAIDLFVERGIAVDSRFALTDDNAPVVAEICRRLDGIPLAIELAASRVQILSPRQLRERLDERFRVLTGGNRNVLPQHQTLRAMIDWSFDLLDDRERALFRRLGIFVNGFTLEGAVAVGSGETLDELDVLDLLASLVAKSLVLADPDGDALRYRLLESTRVYAKEKLDAAGEGEECARRHLHYLQRLFALRRERAEATARTADLERAFVRDLEDLRSALDRHVRSADAVAAGELLASLGDCWRTIGLDAEGLARTEAAIAALEDRDARLTARLWGLNAVFIRSNMSEALAVAERAVELARKSGDDAMLAEALDQYSRRATRCRRFDEAKAALSEAESLPGVSPLLRLRIVAARAFYATLAGDLPAAAAACEQLRAEHRLLGNSALEFSMVLNLAEIAHNTGQTRRAADLIEEAIATLGPRVDFTSRANGYMNFAGYLAALGDLTGARIAARAAIRALSPSSPGGIMVANSIEHFALAEALDSQYERAARLSAYVDAALLRHSYEREFTEQVSHDRLHAILHERLSPEDLDRLTAEGSALATEAAIALAMDDA